MTTHRRTPSRPSPSHRSTRAATLAASLAALALAAVACAGCGDDDGDTAAAASPSSAAAPTSAAAADAAAADSAYCRISLAWTVHELTPFDPTDPDATHAYFDEYLAFADESHAAAPAEIEADWAVTADGFRTLFLPVMEKYGYELGRIANEGTDEERAVLDAPPADVAAAQDRIQAYDARVCGSRQPPAAAVRFEGPAATAYCEATVAFDDANDEAFGTGADPASVEAFVTSPRFTELQEAVVAAAPAEIRDDVEVVETFTAEHGVAALERHGYDVRRLLLEGTAADRAALHSSDPAVAAAFSRTVAYEAQLCGIEQD
jgi:hypothetical protein